MPRVKALLVAVGLAALLCACNSAPEKDGAAPGAPPPPAAAANTITSSTAPLPDNGFKVELAIPSPPASVRLGEQAIINVRVKNASDVPWPARGRPGDGTYQINLGSHWLDDKGDKTVLHEGYRAALPFDLKPGAEAEVPLYVSLPEKPGEYTFEADMVQEGVSWFGLKGAKTTRVKIKVEP